MQSGTRTESCALCGRTNGDPRRILALTHLVYLLKYALILSGIANLGFAAEFVYLLWRK